MSVALKGAFNRTIVELKPETVGNRSGHLEVF